MARGAESKANITNKILEVFPNAFVYGKEIRIPCMESGEQVQIKCALTCAKDNVAGGNATEGALASATASPKDTKMTEAEKEEVRSLMEKLNL